MRAEKLDGCNSDSALPTDTSGRIYAWTAAAFAILLLAGFGPTYMIPVGLGRFEGPAILHIHGLLFFAWPLLFLAQATFATTGRLKMHRSLGLLGIALASATVFSSVAAVSSSLNAWMERGIGE